MININDINSIKIIFILLAKVVTLYIYFSIVQI